MLLTDPLDDDDGEVGRSGSAEPSPAAVGWVGDGVVVVVGSADPSVDGEDSGGSDGAVGDGLPDPPGPSSTCGGSLGDELPLPPGDVEPLVPPGLVEPLVPLGDELPDSGRGATGSGGVGRPSEDAGGGGAGVPSFSGACGLIGVPGVASAALALRNRCCSEK